VGGYFSAGKYYAAHQAKHAAAKEEATLVAAKLERNELRLRQKEAAVCVCVPS
jgi:hypothetical protein